MYTVRPGDDLRAIAQRYGVSMAQLIVANPRLRGGSGQITTGLVEGQGLTIPNQRDTFESRRPAPVQSLQRGATGSAVLCLQKKLLAKGFLSSSALSTGPGIYGPRTEAAVRSFQSSRRLPPTGVAGAQTLAALEGSRIQPLRRRTSPGLPALRSA